jgi:hypothetical protein
MKTALIFAAVAAGQEKPALSRCRGKGCIGEPILRAVIKPQPCDKNKTKGCVKVDPIVPPPSVDSHDKNPNRAPPSVDSHDKNPNQKDCVVIKSGFPNHPGQSGEVGTVRMFIKGVGYDSDKTWITLPGTKNHVPVPEHCSAEDKSNDKGGPKRVEVRCRVDQGNYDCLYRFYNELKLTNDHSTLYFPRLNSGECSMVTEGVSDDDTCIESTEDGELRKVCRPAGTSFQIMLQGHGGFEAFDCKERRVKGPDTVEKKVECRQQGMAGPTEPINFQQAIADTPLQLDETAELANKTDDIVAKDEGANAQAIQESDPAVIAALQDAVNMARNAFDFAKKRFDSAEGDVKRSVQQADEASEVLERATAWASKAHESAKEAMDRIQTLYSRSWNEKMIEKRQAAEKNFEVAKKHYQEANEQKDRKKMDKAKDKMHLCMVELSNITKDIQAYTEAEKNAHKLAEAIPRAEEDMAAKHKKADAANLLWQRYEGKYQTAKKEFIAAKAMVKEAEKKVLAYKDELSASASKVLLI